MPAAARKTDKTMHDAPHCHAPIHPAAPVPTPVPHPSMQPIINAPCAATVKINSLPAARVTDMTLPCSLASCVPNGPGMVAMGSMTVMIELLPAARANDLVAYMGCVAPIPSPTGKIMPPCSPSVMIGG